MLAATGFRSVKGPPRCVCGGLEAGCGGGRLSIPRLNGTFPRLTYSQSRLPPTREHWEKKRTLLFPFVAPNACVTSVLFFLQRPTRHVKLLPTPTIQ